PDAALFHGPCKAGRVTLLPLGPGERGRAAVTYFPGADAGEVLTAVCDLPGRVRAPTRISPAREVVVYDAGVSYSRSLWKNKLLCAAIDFRIVMERDDRAGWCEYWQDPAHTPAVPWMLGKYVVRDADEGCFVWIYLDVAISERSPEAVRQAGIGVSLRREAAYVKWWLKNSDTSATAKTGGGR